MRTSGTTVLRLSREGSPERGWQRSLGMDSSARRKGLAEGLAILSEETGPFDGLTHGLCWVHTERLVHELIPLDEHHREDPPAIRTQLWEFYDSAQALPKSALRP